MASGHLRQIRPRNGVRGYRIEFTANPPTTSRVWWTETPKYPARRADLEKVLEDRSNSESIIEVTEDDTDL